VAQPEPESLPEPPEPEAVEAEVELVPEPVPVAPAEPEEEEPSSEPEPEPLTEPELEPAAEVAFEPAPAPDGFEPGPEPEPEPERHDLADQIAPPTPEAVATPEPEPVAQVIPIVEPTHELQPEPQSQRAPEPEPEPAHASEPEDLPDFIVVPGREGPRAEAEPSTPAPANLGFPPITELVFEPGPREREPHVDVHRPHVEQADDDRDGKDRRRRSSHEPGDEGEETGWMLGLSNRLSAYSLSEEGAGSGPAEPDEPDGDEPADD
jgi:hypothetical protein